MSGLRKYPLADADPQLFSISADVLQKLKLRMQIIRECILVRVGNVRYLQLSGASEIYY